LLLPLISKLERNKPVPVRLTEPVIPLAKREGAHWRLLEKGLDKSQEAVRTSEAYRRAGGYLSGILEAARTSAVYRRMEIYLPGVLERLKNLGSK
jgi:hypothetical protein